MSRRIFSVVLLLAMVLTFLPLCSPVANAAEPVPELTDFEVIGANGWVYVVPQTSGYYYKLSDGSGTAPELDSTDLVGYATKYDITRFKLGACPNETTKYVQVIKVVGGLVKAWGQKAVTPQPMLEYNTGSIDAHGLAITLEQGDDPSKTKIYLDSDKSTPAAILFSSSTLTPEADGAYDLSNTKIYGNYSSSNAVTTTSITMNGGKVIGIYGGSGITSSAAIVINGGDCQIIRGYGSNGGETHKSDIVINGGNVISLLDGSAVKVKNFNDSTVTVNGGYIRSGNHPYNSSTFIEGATPKNSAGNVVEKYILTVKSSGVAVTNTALSALTTYPELGYTYGVNDVEIDSNGNLLVFLPEGVSTVSVVAGGQTYWGTVISNAATLMPRSSAPTADVTSITKTTAVQQSVSYTLTNSPQLSGTCTVYADNTTTAAISTVTAAISGSDMTLTSTGTDTAAGDYYVAVTETDKSESTRLKLTVIQPSYMLTINNAGTGATASGNRAAGEVVTLNPGTKNGYTFKDWTVVSGGIPITSNQLTMPSTPVAITANWTANSVPPPTTPTTPTTPTYTYYTVTASAGSNGSISPAGSNSVRQNNDISFTITPNKGYVIKDVTADGNSVGAVATYAFSNVIANHSIHATFEPEKEQPDRDKNKETDTSAPDIKGWRNPFKDVEQKDWFFESVATLNTLGIMNGTGETTFEPNGSTSRGMIVTLLYRLNDSPSADTTGQEWYSAGQAWAMKKGISDGSSMEEDITREQLAAMLWRYAGSPAVENYYGLSDFSDIDSISDYAKKAMEWAHKNGIMLGDGKGHINPNAKATRAEASAMITRFIAKIQK